MKKHIQYISVLLILLLHLGSNAYSQCTATISGSWDNPAIWSCGHVPLATDNVTFDGKTITVPLGFDAVANNVTGTNTCTFNLHGTLTITNTLTYATSNFNVTGTLSALNITASNSMLLNIENGGTVNYTGLLTFQNNAPKVTVKSGGTLIGNAATFGSTGNPTLEVQAGGSATFTAFTITNDSKAIIDGSLLVKGDLNDNHRNNGGLEGSGKVTVEGDLNLNGDGSALWNGDNLTIEMDGCPQDINISGFTNEHNFVIAKLIQDATCPTDFGGTRNKELRPAIYDMHCNPVDQRPVDGGGGGNFNVPGSTINTCTSQILVVNNLTPFTYCETQGPSASQNTLTVQGIALTDVVTVTPPAGYEVSKDGVSWFSSTSFPKLSLSVVEVTPAFPLQIRLEAGLGAGAHDYTVLGTGFMFESTGAVTQYAQISGSVVAIPAAPIAGSNTPVCEGTPLNLTATLIAGTYSWTGPNGFTSALQNPSIASATLAAAGTYSVTVTVGGCTSIAATTDVVVTASSPVSVTIVADNATICAGTNVTFTATPTNGGAMPTYQWKKNGANVGAGGATYSDATLVSTDVITVELTSNAVCPTGNPATSNALSVTVNPNLPVSVIIVADNATVCAGANVTFTATPTNGGGTPTYQWKKNGANVGAGGATYSDATLVTTDVITVELTSSETCATGNPATSNSESVTVNSNLPVSVIIIADNATICAGTNVTFTATPTNGGAMPIYQWKKNGANVGAGGTTYSDNALISTDVITVELTSNAICPTGNPATSNALSVTVNPNLPVSVIIAADNATVCAGGNVTFTATPTNGGATPTYQWKKNGVNVGAGGATYSDAALVTTDVITVELTSSETCATGSPATSNSESVTVNNNLPVSVTIVADNATVCAGTNVTFTATPTNGGATPTYQWKKNGANVGIGGATYSDATLVTTDVITVELTSSETCATGNPATSNALSVTVNPNLPVSVIIVADNATVCAGANVTFTATPTNGGATPTYQWKKNGINVGTGGTTYSDAALISTDVITVELTSSETCATGNPATSNSQSILVEPNGAVSVLIAADKATVCAGENVTFTATPTNGGATPTYQWKKNGGNVGTGGATYSDNALISTDVITVELTSSSLCVTGNPATSNSESVTVNNNLPVSVTISADDLSVCEGTTITFTAVPTNGGTTPTYQWKKGATNVGTNSATYAANDFVNGDAITVVLTSSETCATNNPATSNLLRPSISPNLPVLVSIVADNATVCAGTNVTFTATPTNGGATPTYQWKKNGANVGTGGVTYSDAALVTTDVITVELTSSETCTTGNPATSNTQTVTVNPNLPVSVSILADDLNVCEGTPITFTASPINGGVTPSYQWKKGVANVGTNSFTYVASDLVNGDVISVVLTSSETCTTGNPATSNTQTVTVNPNLPVSVSILADDLNVCEGTPITFTASPINGGVTPSYQWKKGVANVGTNSFTYVVSDLVNGDVISVVLTSSETCTTGNPATSNTQTVTVNPTLTVSVNISADPLSICSGEEVEFTANPTNGGSSPTYQWQKNGVAIPGEVGVTYKDKSLISTDVISVVLQSNLTCKTGSPASDNAPSITVLPLPEATIEASNPFYCKNENGVTLSLNPVGGVSLATATFNWKRNGVPVGTNPILTNATAGTYTCEIKTSCTYTTLPISITELPVPEVLLNGPTHVCENDADITYSVKNTGAVEVLNIGWERSNSKPIEVQANKSVAVVDWDNAGFETIIATVIGKNSCVTVMQLPVVIHELPLIDFDIDSKHSQYYESVDAVIETDTIYIGTNVSFINQSPKDNMNFQWDYVGEGVFTNSDYNGSFVYDNTGMYTVQLVGVNTIWGCKNSKSVSIEVVPNTNCNLVFPNTFTPAEADNNLFYPIFDSGVSPANYEIKIFNRWGNVIWETTDKDAKWDGMYKGEIVKQDVYVYFCKASCEKKDAKGNPISITKQGNITVLR